MKRLTAAVVLLFSICLGTLICTAVTLQADVSDVRLTEVTHMGDISAADGLTAVTKNHWTNHAFWTTTHALGHAEDAMTEFDFSADRRYSNAGQVIPRLTLETDTSQGFDFTAALDQFGITLGEAEAADFNIVNEHGSFRDAATDRSLGLTAAYNEMYMDATPGVEITRKVRLSDYYDYYPLNLDISLPGVIWTNNDVSPTTIAEPGTEAYAVQYFRDYFKLPMQDEVQEIHLTRNKNHMSWGSSAVEGVSYAFSTLSAADGQNCYFTFNTRTQEDTVIDTSEIRSGYGIYRLPYRKGTSTSDIGVDVDALSMVYPLEPGTVIEALYFNHAQTRLLLVTRPDNTTVQMDVIDPVTYDCLQSFSVGGSFFRHLKIYEDYTVVVTQGKLMVLTEENGVYTHAFTADMLTDENGEVIPVTSDYVTAFNGTRLAVANNARTYYYSGIDMCGYDITVYSAEGLLWYGTVENTLDTGLRRNSYSQTDISPLYGEQLSLFWE